MPNTSGRRHKQALGGYKHLAKRQRPNYKKRDATQSQAHEERLRKADQERRSRGYKGR